MNTHRIARRIPKPLLSSALSVLLVVSPLSAAWAGGEFLQIDVSRDSSSAVASIERRKLTYGATYYNGDESRALSASVLYRLASAQDRAPATIKLGPAIGWSGEEDSDAEAEVGVKLTADRWIDTGFGGLYFQGEVSSVDSTWFLLGQTVFTEPGLTLEISQGSSDTYFETSVAVTKRIGNGPVGLRAGHRFDAEEWFIGASINTF